MSKCELCEKTEPKFQLCFLDHKTHWHGSVHLPDSEGKRGGLYALCDKCYKKERKVHRESKEVE